MGPCRQLFLISEGEDAGWQVIAADHWYQEELSQRYLDLIVELPTSHYNNKNILVMVGHHTGWATAKAIPNKEATTVANTIFQKLILEHGTPEVLSDNGKEFTNDTLAYVCQEFNIEQHFTSPYTPRSNGKTENFNMFLKASIRKLCQEDTTAWNQVLDQILFAYRCCPHTSMGEAPIPSCTTGIHCYQCKN